MRFSFSRPGGLFLLLAALLAAVLVSCGDGPVPAVMAEPPAPAAPGPVPSDVRPPPAALATPSLLDPPLTEVPASVAASVPPPVPGGAPLPQGRQESPVPAPYLEPFVGAGPVPSPAVPAPFSAVAPVSRLETAAQVLSASALAMELVETFCFELGIASSFSGDGLPVQVEMVMSGEFQAPGRMSFSLRMPLGLSEMNVEGVAVGDTLYMLDPLTGEWEAHSGAMDGLAGDPLSFADLAAVDVAFDSLSLPEVVESDGRMLYHLRGELPWGSLEGLLDPGMQPGQPALVEYWIGVEDLLVYRARVDMGFSSDALLAPVPGVSVPPVFGFAQVVVDVSFSDYGKDLDIRPPALTPVP